MEPYKTPEEMAEIIEEIYETKFGGKKRGRYQMSRVHFRMLSGRKRLADSFVWEVFDACLERGLILISFADIIAVIEEGVVLKYRSVTKNIVNSYIGEEDDEDDMLEEIGDDEDDES